MASISWPGSLPDFILRGLPHQMPDQLAVFKPTKGPPLVRREYEGLPHLFRVPMIFTDAEYDAFRTFYITTLKGGSERFDYTTDVALLPGWGTTVECRFAPGTVLNFINSDFEHWTGSLPLEVYEFT